MQEGGNSMENGFIAIPVMFEGTPGYITAGYMVSQYCNGRKVVEQFIPESSYCGFCEAINTVPVMEGGGT